MYRQGQSLSRRSAQRFERPDRAAISGAASREEVQFHTRILRGFAEGHEILTRRAAEGLTGVDLPALMRGVTRPDSGGGGPIRLVSALIRSVEPDVQKRHALRSRAHMTTGEAVLEVSAWLRELSRRATNPGAGAAPATRFEWMGEALHVIQDSYSAAHVERGSANQIVRVRRFWASPAAVRVLALSPLIGVAGLELSRTRGPEEHNFPRDARDEIYERTGDFTAEAQAAIAASREYLHMMAIHQWSGPEKNEMHAFLEQHFMVA